MKLKQTILLLTSLGLLAACSPQTKPASDESSEASSQVDQQVEETSGEDVTIRVRSVGDVLIHDTVYQDAATADGYDFSHQLAAVKPYLENADITVAKLEVIAAGDELPLSTYPAFNAPSEIIDCLKDAGVDIVNNVTNHTLDLGAEGAHASIRALKERDMMYVGSYESWDDYNDLRIIDVNGVKVGFLAYAMDANGNPIPEDEGYLFTQIDTELIPLEVERLNEAADISFINVEMGEEYEYLPNKFQLDIGKLIRDAGGHFVLGGHPHVMQPALRYSDSQGIIFSQGNFISGQWDIENRIGGILETVYTKHKDGKVTLDKMRLMPVYTHGMPESAVCTVMPLADAGEYGIDVEGQFAQIRDYMRVYTDLEVVDYLD
ncbi:CapA family protein [Hutsoniella sourekii]|uniref:CapA family protein n=1 Tax=Hutsoniella sourekii TaxID=87650 RepID=UPI0004886C7F|nr:CapA family protein [Hutsoniella sourekii]